jgi:tripartite motif-containing protein 71
MEAAMHTVQHSKLKKTLVTWLGLVAVLVVSASTPVYRTLAVQFVSIPRWETAWKADRSARPLTNLSFMSADAQGNLYVADRGADGYTYQVVHFAPDGTWVHAWGANGTGPGEFNWRPASPDDGPDAGFVAADSAGNVYVSDGYNFRVQKFSGEGEFLLEWGSAGEQDGQFQPPTVGPVSVDTQGNVYVSDFGRVQIFDSEGQFLRAFGSFGTGDGQFQGAGQVGWDSQGNRYVPDLLNGRIQKFDAAGNFLMQIGRPGEGDGELFMPAQVVVDSQDHIFVMDNTNRVPVFDADGNFLGKLLRPGNGDGPYEAMGSIALDGQDNLYVQFYRPEDGVTIYKFGYSLSYRPEDGVTTYQFSRK